MKFAVGRLLFLACLFAGLLTAQLSEQQQQEEKNIYDSFSDAISALLSGQPQAPVKATRRRHTPARPHSQTTTTANGRKQREAPNTATGSVLRWLEDPNNLAMVVGVVLTVAIVGGGVLTWFAFTSDSDPFHIKPFMKPIVDPYIEPIIEDIEISLTFWEKLFAGCSTCLTVVFVAVPLYLISVMHEHLSSILDQDNWACDKRAKTLRMSVPVAGMLAVIISFLGYFGPILYYGLDSDDCWEAIEQAGWVCVGLAALTIVFSVLWYILRRRNHVGANANSFRHFVVAVCTHLFTAFTIPALLCLVGAQAATIAGAVLFVFMFVASFFVPKADADGGLLV